MKFSKSLLLLAFLASTALANYGSYDKEEQKLTIEDYLRNEGTKDGAKQIINKYKNKSLTELDYTLVVVKEVHNNVNKPDPVEDRDFPNELLKLKNINNISKLTLTYEKTERDHSWHETYHKGSIKKGFLKKFKSLNILELNHIKLSQDNIKEIAALSGLRTLVLNECEFNKLNFKPFKDHENLLYLQIISRYGNYEYGGDINANILKYFNKLDSIDIEGYEFSQTNIDEICSLKTVERLTYPTNNKINTECVKNMGISHLDLTYYDHSMDGDDYDEDFVRTVEKLNLPDRLFSLTYHGIDLTEDNNKEIASVSKLEHLIQIVGDEEKSEDLEEFRKKYSVEEDEELSHYVEFERINEILTINDYYQKEGTKYGAKQIINEYKNKAITKLDYNLIVVKEVHNNIDEVDPVQDRDFPKEILQFKDLMYLSLNYQKTESDHSWHKNYIKGSIKKGYIKNLKNLKSLRYLTLKNINLSQDNINEIATLSDLYSLTLVECEFNKLNFKSIKNLTNLEELKIISRYGNYNYGGDINANILKYFKNLDTLKIEGYEISQANMNEICNMKLNHLAYPVNKKINTECQKDLSVQELEITYYEHSMDGDDYDEDIVKSVEKLNLPKELGVFYYRNIDLTKDNYQEIISSSAYGIGKYISDDEIDYKEIDEFKKKYSTNESEAITISTDGRCGPEHGNTVCPNSKCCSKYGWCGISDAHCKAGCLSEFGECK